MHVYIFIFIFIFICKCVCVCVCVCEGIKKEDGWKIKKATKKTTSAMSSSRSDDVTKCVCVCVSVCLKSFFFIEHSKHLKQYV